MDIHKPKAVHSLREFLIELGTIVCGILIALAGEEAVVSLHRHEQVDALRQVLNRELAWNMADMRDVAYDAPCVMQRMDELERWKASFKAGRPLPLARAITRPSYVLFRTSAWRSSASNAIDALPLEARTAYSQFYDSIDHNERWRDETLKLWSDLSDFSDAESLSPAEARQIGHAIREIRTNYKTFAANYRVWRELYAPPIHVRVEDAPQQDAKKSFTEGRAEICKPLLAPQHPVSAASVS
jgi:hypothetical protein